LSATDDSPSSASVRARTACAETIERRGYRPG